MSSKSKLKAQVKATKEEEEAIAQQNLKTEVARQKKIVQDVIFPYLLTNGKSLNDASNLLYETETIVKQSFQAEVMALQKSLSDRPIDTMPLTDVLKNDEHFNRVKGLLELLKGEKVTTVHGLIEGLKKVLDGAVFKDAMEKDIVGFDSSKLTS